MLLMSSPFLGTLGIVGIAVVASVLVLFVVRSKRSQVTDWEEAYRTIEHRVRHPWQHPIATLRRTLRVR